MLPRWLIRFRAFTLASAFAAAFVPIATYITDDKRDWLWIHIGVNIAAYIAVALTTIYTTVNLTQQDHNKYHVPAYWANNVVMRTWYLGVSKTWRWHVAAAVGRLGLALALAQHVTRLIYAPGPIAGVDFEGIVAPFLDIHAWNGYEKVFMVSQWETTLIGLCLLVCLAALETGLLSAFTLIGHAVWKRQAVLTAVVLRAGIVLVLIGGMAGIHSLFNPSSGYGAGYDRKVSPPYREMRVQNSLKEWFWIGFSWLDNGTMIATWVVRPAGSVDLNHPYCQTEESELNSICVPVDNRAMVALDILRAVVSGVTYIAGIALSLLVAQRWTRLQEYAFATVSNNSSHHTHQG
jgi:hypothetical protein